MNEDNEIIDTTDNSPEPSYEPSEAQPSYGAPPQAWQREIAERHWKALPDDLRGYIHTREKEAGGKISELGSRVSDLDEIVTRYGGINSVFQKYRAHLPEGLDPDKAVESLLQAHQRLSAPESRQSAISELLASYGIGAMDLLPAERRQQLELAEREYQGAKQAELQRTLDDFTRDKSYYPEIRDAVIQEILALRQQAPGLDPATVLRLAHDRVCERTGIKSRLDLEAKARAFEESQRAAAERQKAERAEMDKRMKAARRAGSINVRSTPVSNAPRTLDQDLRAIADRAYGR